MQMRFVWIVMLCGVLGVLASCSDAEPNHSDETRDTKESQGEIDAKQRLAVRAASSVDTTYAGEYTFIPAGDDRETQVQVIKVADTLKYAYEVPETSTEYTFSSTWYISDDRILQCVETLHGEGCVQSSGSTLREDALATPALAFTQWMGELAQRSSAISVQRGKSSAKAQCFSVEKLTSSLNSPVGTGEYCFTDEGYIASLSLAVGVLKYRAARDVPDTTELPAEVRAQLPSVQKPKPTPSPSASLLPSE